MASYYLNSGSASEASTGPKTRSLMLKFSTRVASPVFTGKKIRGEGGGGDDQSIGVILVDRQTQQQVITGPVASAKVQIVLIPKEFGGGATCAGDSSVWTPLDFKNNIITDLKNKKNLLLGDPFLVLKHGSGIVGEIRIKHDRNYLSKVKLRLGAMVVDCSDEVKEAITHPFEIKDRRNESTSKNRPLLLTDKVWLLKNISRKGKALVRKRLEKAKVKTVKDFLDMLSLDPRGLQKMCGSKGKKWETTVRHAETCIDDKVGYVCGSSSQPGNVSFVDYDDCNILEVETYEPGSYENGPLSEDMMTISQFLSAQEIKECLELVNQEGASGGLKTVGGGGGMEGGMAKKRWIKLYRVWFSMVSFTKRVGGAGVGVTLVG